MTVRLYFLCILCFNFGRSFNDENDPSFWSHRGKAELEEALKISLNHQKAKNVILFVGDGMGPSTLTASRIHYKKEGGHLIFEKFPHMGLLKTYSVDMTVSESASTANALFTGVKTNYEVVGLTASVKVKDCSAALNHTFELESIMDWAQKANLGTGFVTNTRVTHATPSALYAHSADRKWECDRKIPENAKSCMDIAKQLVLKSPGNKFQVIMGGGRQGLETNSSTSNIDPLDQWACYRQDGRNLTKLWLEEKAKAGKEAVYLRSKADLEKLNIKKTDYILGLFANSHIKYTDMKTTLDEEPPSLAQMTEAAIKILQKNKNGFVLMVEGGLIDLAHHRGYIRRALQETLEFEKAISTALTLTNSNDTLIIVTADHAHSLVINGISSGRGNVFDLTEPSKIDGIPYPTLSYMVGGPENFAYELDNGKVRRKDPSLSDRSNPNYQPQAGFVNDEVIHSGVDVHVFARGPKAHLFHNVHEQSYVAYVIAYAVEIGPYAKAKNNGQDLRAPLFTAVLLILVNLL